MKPIKIIKWRLRALEDMLDISNYIGRDSFFTAQIFSKKIKEKISVLSAHPELGRIGIVRGTRELVVHANYVIIYEVSNTKIEIMRIKHAAREYRE
jgi:toxin ParE1/3/4